MTMGFSPAISPDGTLLAHPTSRARLTEAQLIDIRQLPSLEKISTINFGTEHPAAIFFTGDNSKLVTTTEKLAAPKWEIRVRLFEVATGNAIARGGLFARTEDRDNVAIPSGRAAPQVIAMPDSQGKVLRIQTLDKPKQLGDLKDSYNFTGEFTPGGRFFVGSRSPRDPWEMAVWDVSTLSRVATVKSREHLLQMAPDGSLILTSSMGDPGRGSLFSIRDVTSLAVVPTFARVQFAPMSRPAFTSNSNILAVATPAGIEF